MSVVHEDSWLVHQDWRTTSEPCGVEAQQRCERFLFREAELLDDGRYLDWFTTCLAEDLQYAMPIRTTRERAAGQSEYSSVGFHMIDTHGTMRLRVDRLLTEHAWAEDPASRTSRLVTNVRVRELGEGRYAVRSKLTVYHLIVAERQDLLSQGPGGLLLHQRSVLLAHTILDTPNLGIFL
jgi:3-phenylpropionate/cinnamic acid dioxygenase small subunit